jgi:Polyketide cyclase / dehydrase and lipid transport
MASIHRESLINTRVEDAWDALRDFDAVHERVAPGFVTACRPDGGARLVTFYDGVTARELPVVIDDDRRRLVYAIAPGAGGVEHYNASVEVTAEPGGGTRLTWTIDLLPDELAGWIGERMDIGLAAIKKTWEAQAAAVG